MTEEDGAPYKITLELDGWFWTEDDLHRMTKHLSEVIRKNSQAPDSGASVRLRSLKWKRVD